MGTRQHGRPPTEAQIRFATAIAERLHICLPGDRTRQSMFLFIRDNVDRFNRLGAVACVPTLADLDPDPDEAFLLGLDIDGTRGYTGD